jgi:hypothetical protein
VFGRNFITELTSAASPRVDISSTCKVGQKLESLSPSVDMLPYGVTILATVPQRSEIREGLMNYHVYSAVIKILDRKWKYDRALHQLFVHFKKAYDLVRRDMWCNILIEFGIPKNLDSVIRMHV